MLQVVSLMINAAATMPPLLDRIAIVACRRIRSTDFASMQQKCSENLARVYCSLTRAGDAVSVPIFGTLLAAYQSGTPGDSAAIAAVLIEK